MSFKPWPTWRARIAYHALPVALLLLSAALCWAAVVVRTRSGGPEDMRESVQVRP